jgi:23S rRNA (guanosine2251-2'-O)-methyltransferase
LKKLRNDELNRLTVEAFRAASKMPLVIVLDNIRSGHNVGSIFRTADAFRAAAIHLCGITARPPHREIHKTALGATESVEWRYFTDIRMSLALLRSMNHDIYAVEQTDVSTPLKEFHPPFVKPLAIVFGNEVGGVQEEVLALADGCLEIPQYGTKHSLNIAVSAGIVIHDLFMKYVQATKNIF